MFKNWIYHFLLLFKKLFSDSRNLIFSLSNIASSFLLFESSGFSFSLFSFNNKKYCFSSEKYCWGNTILMLLFYKISLSSDDLIWVSLSSEWCFGVAAVFKIGVVATSTIGVMLDELNWDGWPSKSVLSEISEQIPTSLSRGGGGDLKPQSLH